MINSFLGASAFLIACYVVDILLVVAAIGLFVWYYVKTSKQKNPVQRNRVDENAEKINDDTYVISAEPVVEAEPEPVKADNVVEHFVNQISVINDAANAEASESAIVVKHEVEQPVKRVPRKDEIQNYVMIGGAKKEKTESEIRTSYNTGSDAFKKSTDFLNTIKQQTVETAEKKPAAAPKKKTTK